MFCKSRKLTKVWHQARLNVLPLNNFLKRIRKHNTGLCSYDDEIEDTEHFIKRCKLYDGVWKNLYYHRERRIKNYVSLLDLDKPPEFKRLVCVNLIKGLWKRKASEQLAKENKKVKT